MSAKEVGLIVIFTFIIIGGFIFLAPEYQKNAQLKETYEQNKKMRLGEEACEPKRVKYRGLGA